MDGGSVGEFDTDSLARLVRLDDGLGYLERSSDADVVAIALCTFDSFERTADVLGFSSRAAGRHTAENVLSKLGDDDLVVSVKAASGVRAAVDAVREMFGAIALSGAEAQWSCGELTERSLGAVCGGAGSTLLTTSWSRVEP